MDLEALRERYLDELRNSVIPFWTAHGVDTVHGGFLTCLDRTGEVYDDRKYIWLQGRGVWSFSKFYNNLERNPEWLRIAQRGAEFLAQHAFDEQGRCWFSTSRDGLTPTGYQRKPYAAVFVFLGFWEYFKASGDFKYHTLALNLFEDIRAWIANPELIGRPFPAPPNLADCMVVLSMAIKIATVASDPKYHQIIHDMVNLAETFLDKVHNVLLENTPNRATPEGRLFCPGSSIEVAWFLIHGEIALQNHEAIAIKEKTKLPQHYNRIRRWLDVIEASLELGWDKEHGGLYYFMDIEGKPTLQLESTMKLWWPHTEALYACVLAVMETREYAERMRNKADSVSRDAEPPLQQRTATVREQTSRERHSQAQSSNAPRSHAERAEDLEAELPKWSAWLDRINDYAFTHFADPQHGEWFAYCDRQGNLTHTLKGNNYKGCFHVPRALLFAAHRIRRY